MLFVASAVSFGSASSLQHTCIIHAFFHSRQEAVYQPRIDGEICHYDRQKTYECRTEARLSWGAHRVHTWSNAVLASSLPPSGYEWFWLCCASSNSIRKISHNSWWSSWYWLFASVLISKVVGPSTFTDEQCTAFIGDSLGSVHYAVHGRDEWLLDLCLQVENARRHAMHSQSANIFAFSCMCAHAKMLARMQSYSKSYYSFHFSH